MEYYYLAIAVLVLILIVWYRQKSSFSNIVSAVAQTKKAGKGYTYFTGLIGNPNFSPFIYSQLMAAYTAGKLNNNTANQMLLTLPV
jgi:hypothetical protein